MSEGDAIDGIVKPLAPFNRNPQKAVYSDFINYHDGRIMNGVQYWKKMDSVFFEYMNHKESKFDGDVGILRRRHLKVGSVVNMGKESNNLEESEWLGVQDDDYQLYTSHNDLERREEELKAFILNLEQKDAKGYGIPKQTLSDIKKRVRAGGKIRLSKNVGRRIGIAFSQKYA
jgi:hypothetical protein